MSNFSDVSARPNGICAMNYHELGGSGVRATDFSFCAQVQLQLHGTFASVRYATREIEWFSYFDGVIRFYDG